MLKRWPMAATATDIDWRVHEFRRLPLIGTVLHIRGSSYTVAAAGVSIDDGGWVVLSTDTTVSRQIHIDELNLMMHW